jgi:hypothetical protein
VVFSMKQFQPSRYLKMQKNRQPSDISAESFFSKPGIYRPGFFILYEKVMP